ncbi:phospholipase D-like domain-containing protein [Methyloprofundus sp.]|uniref:phospholipase D-like domain-containing protein n=1 Tax=Methyloprofundus sp. TaxID=2020875 RepID=UPI003D135EF6
MTNHPEKIIVALLAALLLGSCADLSHKPAIVPQAVKSDDFVTMNYQQRSWVPADEMLFDPIAVGSMAEIPVNHVRSKIIGPSYQDAVNSLAAKIWMIENAQYTVDLVYYIFKRDTVGYAILGALCNAVKRGVDVRLMVDSVGSIHTSHKELKALETCADKAGYIKDEAGIVTPNKARIQVVIINALSKAFVRINRRSHDKLIVIDGHVADKAIIMTGGRNISVAYYGINEDGSPDPTAYQDLEIVLRPDMETENKELSVGTLTTHYYTLLFLHAGNRRLRPSTWFQWGYQQEKDKAQEKLNFVKNIPAIQTSLAKMPSFLNTGYSNSMVKLVHQLDNLTNENVVTDALENLQQNLNSIHNISTALITHMVGPVKTLRISSPYYFLARYDDAEGDVVFDTVKNTYRWLEENPQSSVEIITNSVLTSDNFSAQAVIDMDTAPQLLLSPELLEQWLSGLEEGEFNPELVESEAWKKSVNNPRLKIYQTGKLDSVLLGGDQHYGKLHAKSVVFGDVGYVGTSNFDYRSRLFNNEFGYFFKGDELAADLKQVFADLKAKSYRWGSPEWLEMRKQLMALDTSKASATRKQRGLFKTLR